MAKAERLNDLNGLNLQAQDGGIDEQLKSLACLMSR
jgi:hypothetical protein